jgi:hypothetical protein
VTEDELLTAVTSGTKRNPGLCKVLGVRYFHAYNSRHSVPGFPDLVLVGRHGVAYRELKSDWGTPSPDQTTWKYALLAIGQDWGIWRPRDLASGLIRAELAALMTADKNKPPSRLN